MANFLPGLSDMAHPLRQLTRKDAKWVWSETQEKAWSDIKTAISRACKMRLHSNATLLTQGWEPFCFSFSSQWVLYLELLLKPKPGTLKLRRSFLPSCLPVKSLTSTSLGEILWTWRPTISLWKRSLRKAFAMLRQGFNGCYCIFNTTIPTLRYEDGTF